MSSTTVDTQDMVIVHKVFRREFKLGPELVDGVADGDTARAAVVGRHLRDIMFGLHHHHGGEDELLWPVLLERATPQQELIHRMESQHHAMSAALDRIEQVLPAWEQHARKADGDQLSAALRETTTILCEHLDEEEREILPLVRDTLTVEEWEALGKRGVEAFQDKEKMILFLGAILEDATPDERKYFMGNIPLPGRVMWRLLGRKKYADYVSALRTGVDRKAS